MVSLLGLLICVVAVGKSPHLSDLLLGRNEDGKSRTDAAKKQSSRIFAERTTQAKESGADINASADINEAKQKQTYSCDGGCLTTHILDTANGIPAEGMGISLHRIAHASKDEQNQNADGESRTKLGTFTTNADGRIDGTSLLSGDDFIAGEYELIFHVSAYFDGRIEQQHMKQQDGIPFLSKVPIRFGVEDATMHYHIPLLVSKYSYSTYHGS